MKKILALLLTLSLLLVLAIPVPASACGFAASGWRGWICRWWSIFRPPDLGVPAVTVASYVHSHYITPHLLIDWDPVEGADSYEVLITRADGTVETCTTDTDLLCRGMECPKVYIDSTGTWTAATVQVRALSGSRAGDWSAAVKIGCNMIH